MPLFRLWNLCKIINLGHYSKNVQDTHMKLGTNIARDSADMSSKGHNSGFNNHWVMPLFRLRNLCKIFYLAHNSKTIQDTNMKLGTHIARDSAHMCNKGTNSGSNNYWVMPHFWLRNLCKISILAWPLLEKRSRYSHETWKTHCKRQWAYFLLNSFWVMPLFKLKKIWQALAFSSRRTCWMLT